MRSLSFDELAPDSSVPMAAGQMLHASDLVMIALDKSRVWANKVLKYDLDKEFATSKITMNHVSDGSKSRCKLIGLENAIDLIKALPGNNDSERRLKCIEIIQRYISENPLLRPKAAAAESAGKKRAQPEAFDATDDQKRRRGELEIQKLESEIRCNERASLIAERESRLSIVDKYENVSSNPAFDQHAKDVFRTMLLNEAGQTGVFMGNPDTTPISISQAGANLGYHLTTEQYKKVGKIAGKLYREQHGMPPGKHPQLVNGQSIDVNTYFAKDTDLLKQAFEQYRKETNVPPGPGLERWFNRQ